MILGRVTGSVHATLGNAHLEGQRLLLVDPVDLGGKPSGKPLVCIDRVEAGPGDLVLVNREGGAARMLLQDERSPVQAVVVAVVDSMQVKI
ncbi:MAG: ethanolamine utilization protein EutN [Planctomycetes bacterium]|nr:ethanolamine utilization protein EutN [Planctomycetota bacterium]